MLGGTRGVVCVVMLTPLGGFEIVCRLNPAPREQEAANWCGTRGDGLNANKRLHFATYTLFVALIEPCFLASNPCGSRARSGSYAIFV